MPPQWDGEQQDEDQEHNHHQPQHRQQYAGRQRTENFDEFTPHEQHAWLRVRFDWCFAVADHFQPMSYTTVEIAIRLLCDYMHGRHLRELPMDHVMRCSAAACLRIAILLNEFNYITLQDFIRIGENRFTEDEIFESEFHVYHSLGHHILSPRTIESYAVDYMVLWEQTDGNGSISDLWEPLVRWIRLAIRDLIFLEYPVNNVGLTTVVMTLREHTPSLTVIYQALSIPDNSPEAAAVTEIGNRLQILWQGPLHEDD